MSSTDAPDASSSKASRKSRWNPFRSRSSKSGPKLASVKSAGENRSHEAVNIHISGGQGGSGGNGGLQGGGGGTGEGPTLQYNIKTEHLTMNTMGTGSAVHTSSAVVQASQALHHCPPPSQIFHGRTAILDSMHQFFARDTGKQKRYVLYGLGGAGKTQIALKFIQESNYFTDQLLVDASNTNTIETSLMNVAATEQAGKSSQDVLNLLANKHEEWLLFLDNADDPTINLNHWFPRCNHGNIIITTRNHMSNMEKLDAVALLLKSALCPSSPTNVQLAAEIVKNQTKLLKERPTQTYDNYASAVYTTWEMSFKKLSNQAAMFLQLCSFLHQDDISEDIFARAANYIMKSHNQSPNQSLSHKEMKPEEFLSYFLGPSGDWNSLQFSELTNEIKAYSLINYNTERNSFSIHPLVHTWSRTTLPDPELCHSCMGEMLGMSIVEISDQDMGLASLRLVSHVDSLIQVIPGLTTNFLGQYANIYHYTGQHTKAKKLNLNEVDRHRKCSGDDHPDTLLAMHRLAITHDKLGQFDEARKLYAVVLDKQKQLLRDNHPDTLHTMHSLASTYDNLGQFEEAKKLKIEVLEKRQKLLGDDHPDTLYTMHNLAMSYDNLGQFEEAKKLKIEVLEKRQKLLGDDHLETLQTMHNLAVSYDHFGQFEEAEELRVVVLEKRRKFLGDDHPDTLHAMNNLAVTHYNLGQFEEAEKLYVVVLQKRRKLLGDDHPYTLQGMKYLADTYEHLGQTEEAENLRAILLEKGRKQ
ncbi:hypothetical protein C8R45DRAFT_1185122 [Mycena sanguinolenta]|nr:hypothetical protein C8R45DRAFT_1185122 [Mycena sanguinolenta]